MMKFLLSVVFACLMSILYAHPPDLACDDVRARARIMGNAPVLDSNIAVSFLKNGTAMACGGTFFISDVLAVSNSIESGGNFETLLGITGANFKVSPKCSGAQLQGRNNAIPSTAPITATANTISVYGARASGYSTVRYSNTCTITQDAADVTQLPEGPSSPPTIAPGSSTGNGIANLFANLTVGAFLGIAVGIIFAVGGVLFLVKVMNSEN